ncbi:MAG: TlpA family protein disulfide reductase [Chitinophagaceae bacterium]
MKLLRIGFACLLFLSIITALYFWYIVKAKKVDEIRFIEEENTIHSFQDLVNHPYLKGKPIYVDFWHTGCSPCLKEFIFIPALKQQLPNAGKLVFLYLGKDRSVPGEKIRWKKMIFDKQLKGVHFFMKNEFFEKIWLETVNDPHVFKAFPHYLLVNKEGKVVNNNAPRPSDKATLRLLTEINN